MPISNMAGHTTKVCLLFVLFLCIVFPCKLPDDRLSSVQVQLDCGTTDDDHAVIRYKYTGNSFIFISFAQLICAGDSVPFTSTDNGFTVLSAYFPFQNTSNISRPCIFKEHLNTIVDNNTLDRYTVYLSMLWSDGYPGYVKLICDNYEGGRDARIPQADDDSNILPEHGEGYNDTNDEPQSADDDDTITEPGGGGGGSTPPGGESFPGIIDADCDRNTNPGHEAASIHIITDLHLSAIAYCQNSTQVEFFTADTVNLYLNVTYNKDNPSPGECVFPNYDGDSFSIQIEVWEGERFRKVHLFHKDFIITCLYRSVVQNGSSWVASVHSTLTNPKDIIVHSGVTSNSVVTLQAVDVLSRPLTETYIHLGRPIRLLGVSDGSLGEFGLRPVSCYVIGSMYNQRYAILRAGCGDGIIFPKNKGFTTKGLVTKSPYFTAFAMSLNSQVGFQCTFTFCDKPCDGNSCVLSGNNKK